MPDQSVTVFGIRHHGPGCARALVEALERLQPDLVLVEGPPDAQGALSLLAGHEFTPPVALLVYPPDRPERAVYYPFTTFSPEWQALHYAVRHAIPARFMDLPQAVMLARRPQDLPVTAQVTPERESAVSAVEPTVAPEPEASDVPTGDAALHDDPIGVLAQAAGYEDRELWWEQQIEQRQDATGMFEAILEVMAALRNEAGPPRDPDELLREAHMRQTLRAARREGFGRIAVVCGAWHAPVLLDTSSAGEDAALLKGLPKLAVAATWIPWTNSRLATRSGYGAGVASPGWYEHLWLTRDRAAIRWVTLAARLLREHDLDASPAGVIEAVRTAETLAALRDLPMPGIAELNEALLTVLCHGEPAPMTLIRDQLEIGERLGAVPDETPTVPLHRDLTALQRRLRLPPGAEIRILDLDLRKDTDRARSHLLHRLALLGIAWGTPADQGGKLGTFHEYWQLQWQPEFAVKLIEANVWGNTVESAAAAAIRQRAREAQELPPLTGILDTAMLADLPGAIGFILGCIGAVAAVASDLRHLMDALPPLARVARYGDVRGTRVDHLMPVITGLFARALVGLPGACRALDDAAAAAMVAGIGHVQESINLLDWAEAREEWQATLRSLLATDSLHGLLRGWACRLLLEAHVLDEDELQRLARLALSTVNPPAQAAAWVEGVLRGSGLLLMHQDGVWAALNRWLVELDPETFTAVLPLLRRAFSGFTQPERRSMGEKIRTIARHGGAHGLGSIGGQDGPPSDEQRADTVLPVLARILGVTGWDR